jgi:hypothetical protein
MEQVVLKYWNERLHIALGDWRTIYLLEKGLVSLIPEVYKGTLVYRAKGSSRRYSYKEIKKGIVKRKLVINIHLPF